MLRITVPHQLANLHNNSAQGDQGLPMGTDLTSLDHKSFDLSVDVYLKDTCPYQNTYFSRYLEWQGMCRERFLAEIILAGESYDGIFLTKCCHQEYKEETFAFQRVTVRLNTFDVRQASLFLLFQFFVDNKLVSGGYQQIVCAGKDRQIQRFPDFVYARAKEYEVRPVKTLSH